jgi:hypothetical protein
VAASVALAAAATVGAQGIEPVQAEDVKPAPPAQGVKPIRPAPSVRSRARRTAAKPLSYYFGAWHTWVPGAVQTTPDGFEGGQGTVAQGGAAGKALVIRANRTWRWHALTGRWRVTGDPDSPLELMRALEGKTWRVGHGTWGTPGAQIVVFDDHTGYYGKRARAS